MGAEEKLKLGVLFTGDTTSLDAAIKKINATLANLNKHLNAVAKSTNATATSHKKLTSEITAYQVAAGKALSRTKAYQQAFAKLGVTHGKSEAAMRKWLPMLNKADDAIGRQAMAFEQAGIGGKKYYDTASRLSVMQGKLAKKLKYTSDGISHVSKSTKKAVTATKKLSAATKTATKSITFMGKQIGSIDGAYNRLMGAMKVTVSYGIAATAIYSVINAMKSGATAIIEYNQGLKNIEAITGATAYEVSAMGETIKDVARETKFSATEIVNGMTLLGQAGLDAGESITAMNDTAMLATGTLSNMQTSTDLVSTTIRAFGMAATESGRIVDVMANAINKSKLTIDKLRTAFNYVAATASQAGLTLEETAGTMMTLANNGLRASTIGTGLRQVLSRVIKPSEKMATALAKVGLSLDDINPSMVGWQGTLKALSAVLYDSETKTVDMAKAFGLFGLRGAQAAAVVVKSFVSGDYEKAMRNVYEIGTAEEMAAIQAKGLGVMLKNVADRAGLVAVAFGEAGASGAIRAFLNGMKSLLAVAETFVGSTAGKVITQLAAIAGSFKLATIAGKAFFALMMKSTAISATVMTFRGLATTLSGKTGLAGAFVTAGIYLKTFLAKLNPLTIAIGAITGLVLAYKASLENSLKAAEEAAVKNMGIVSSLEAYQGALKDSSAKVLKFKDDTERSKVANEAYITILKRLIKDHPELASKIKLTSDAVEENTRALSEFASNAHIDKIKALGDLVNEYGKAIERSKIWSGFLQLFADSWKMVTTETKNAITAADGFGDKLKELGAKAEKHLPIIGTALKLMGWEMNQVSKTVKTSLTWWKKFFIGVSKGSKETIALIKNQEEALNAVADAYIESGEKAKLSYGEIKRQLEATGKYTDAMIAIIIAATAKGRDAATSYSDTLKNTVTEATTKMTASWVEYYRVQDIKGKYAVQEEWNNLQKRAKDFADWLADQAQAGKISRKEMYDQIVQWWDEQLAVYKSGLEKQNNELTNSLDKRQTEYQKYADKIKSIEDKLAEDIKLLRQSEMTDAQKNSDDLITARQALADAVTAVSEATTAKELEEATKKVEIARAAYGDIVRAANTAGSLEITAQEKSTAAKKAIKTEELGWFTTNWELAAAREQIWNDAVIKNLKAERDLYNKWYGKKADERAAADETASEKMKTAATEAFAVITGLLEDLQSKFTKKNELNLDTKNAEEGIGNVEKKVSRVDTIVKDGKVYKIDSTKSNVDATALADTIDRVDTITKDGAVYVVDSTKSNVDATALADTIDRVDTITKDGAVYVVDSDKSIADIGTLKENIEETGRIAVDPKIYMLDSMEAISDTETIKTTMTDIKTLADTTTVVTLDGTQPISVLDTIKEKLLYIVNGGTSWLSKHTITVIGLGALREAKRLHEWLNGRNTTSSHTVKVDGEASTTKPLGEKMAEINGWFDSLKAKLDKGTKYKVNFTGTGSNELPLGEKTKEVESEINGLSNTVKEGSTYTVNFEGTSSTGSGSIADKVKEIKEVIGSLPSAWKEYFDSLSGQYKLDFYEYAKSTSEKAAKLKEFMASVGSSQSEINGVLATLYAEDLAEYQKNTDAKAQTTAEFLSALPSDYQAVLKDLAGQYVSDFLAFASSTQKKVDENAIAMAAIGRSENEITNTRKILYKDALDGYVESLNKMEGKTTITTDKIRNDFDTATGSTENASETMANTWVDALNIIIKKIDELISKLGTLSKTKAEISRDYVVEWGTMGKTYRNKYWYEKKNGGTIGFTGGGSPKDSGGKLSGYGGGDTVPAMLEKGEFVIRKEAVAKYGAGLFASLNSMVSGMKIGGSVPRVQMPKFAQGGAVSASQMSGKLHTINLNINNTPHTVYGDDQAVSGLLKTLRREQLLTA